MNRRNFLKAAGAGALTLFLSGCGLSALTDDQNKKTVTAPEKGSVSGGKNMKIVVVNSSPHGMERRGTDLGDRLRRTLLGGKVGVCRYGL